VAACQHGDQDLVDDVALTENDTADRFADGSEAGDGVFNFTHDGIGIVEGLHGVGH
jgi:hypothetical protein